MAQRLFVSRVNTARVYSNIATRVVNEQKRNIKVQTTNGFILCGNVWIRQNRISAFHKNGDTDVKIYVSDNLIVNATFPSQRGMQLWMRNVLGENDVKYRNDFEDELYKKYLEDKLAADGKY